MSDPFVTNPEDKFEEALALLEAGMPLAEVLEHMDEDADWLRPMLTTSEELQGLRDDITVPAPDASLQAMLDYVDTLDAPPTETTWLDTLRHWLSGPSLLIGGVALLLVLFVGGILYQVAQESLPGQPLYGLKRTGESVQLAFASPMMESRLQATFNQRRIAEAEQLAAQNLAAETSFEGEITEVDGERLTLDDLEIAITEETEIEGTLTAGAEIAVTVRSLLSGALVAQTIEVLIPGPTPTPSPTATATATETPQPTSTATATPLPTSTATATPPPTNTATPLPTVTPTPVLVAPPVEEDTLDNSNEADDLDDFSDNASDSDDPIDDLDDADDLDDFEDFNDGGDFDDFDGSDDDSFDDGGSGDGGGAGGDSGDDSFDGGDNNGGGSDDDGDDDDSSDDSDDSDDSDSDDGDDDDD